MSALIQPTPKELIVINHELQSNDRERRLKALDEISKFVTLKSYDSMAYRQFLKRHTNKNKELDTAVRAAAFETIADIIEHEFKEGVRPNPHLPYTDTINGTLKSDKNEDVLDAALSCYGVIAADSEYVRKTTKGLSEISRGLQDLIDNLYAAFITADHARDYKYLFTQNGGLSEVFNNAKINFDIHKNRDPEEKNNMSPIAEIDELRKRIEKMATATSRGTIRLHGEFNGVETDIEIPKDAVNQILKDMLFHRYTIFDKVQISKSGDITAEGCQPQ